MGNIEDTWNSSDPYEYFMGRWSKLMAPVFLSWLNPSFHKSWLDLGCGTGALSESIYFNYEPSNLTCLDLSAGFLKKATERLPGNVNFKIGNASNIPNSNDSFDIIVSGLALNFFPDLESALIEMKRVIKPTGIIAAYVWDYAGRMDFLRHFWDTAFEVDPGSYKQDEGVRFPICNIYNLKMLFQKAALSNIEISYLDIHTVFKNFEDYWQPFLGAQGPAPSYLASLNENLQNSIKSSLRKKMIVEPDGSIKLLARAIAIKGIFNQ